MNAEEIYSNSNCFQRKLSKKNLEIIKKDLYYSVEYAKVTKKRWIEAEEYILEEELLKELNRDIYVSYEKNFGIISDYCANVVNGRWKELEEKIQRLNLSYLALHYAQDVIEDRWVEGEETISKDPCAAYEYAHFSLNDRFEMGEEVIKKHPEYAARYSIDVLKKRWREAEPYILQNTDYEHSLSYCELLKDRWPEFESKIISNAHVCMKYVKITRKRWHEFENKLLRLSPQKIIQYFNSVGKISEALHNKMIMLSFDEKHKEKVNEYFYLVEQKKKKHRRFLDKISRHISKYKDKTVEQVIDILAKEEYEHFEKTSEPSEN